MINMLPPDFKSELRASKINSRLRIYIIISIVAIVMISAMSVYALIGLRQVNNQAKARASSNQHKVASLQESSNEAKNLSRRVSAIGSLISQKLSISDVVVNIGKNTPQGASLTGLQLDVADASSKPITLIFGVNSKETAAILRNNLVQDSNFFSGINLISLTAQNQESTESSTGSSDGTNQYPYVAILEVTLVSQDNNKVDHEKK